MPIPNKKPVGRRRKALSSKELASMLEQNHDYNKLLKEFEKRHAIVTNIYLSNKKVSVNDETEIPRKRFTEERKQKNSGNITY